MSIFILHAAPAAPWQHARLSTASQPVELIHCNSVAGLVGGLHLARNHHANVVVLDAGALPEHDCQLHADAMRQALDLLPAPYIELHDRSTQEISHWAHPQHAALAVFNLDHDGDRRHAMALAVAARLCSLPHPFLH